MVESRTLSQAPYIKTIEWAKWHIFWADERVVAKNHADSNYKLAKDNFLSKVFTYASAHSNHLKCRCYIFVMVKSSHWIFNHTSQTWMWSIDSFLTLFLNLLKSSTSSTYASDVILISGYLFFNAVTVLYTCSLLLNWEACIVSE